MARIEIAPGEAIEVTFQGTDGIITVAFKPLDINILVGCDAELAKDLPSGITVHADMYDAQGREGLIYHEPFNEDLDVEEEKPDLPAWVVTAARAEAERLRAEGKQLLEQAAEIEREHGIRPKVRM